MGRTVPADTLEGTRVYQLRYGDMTATHLVTADELFRLGSDAGYELIDGVLHDVSPSSSKSSVIGVRISSAIFAFVDARQLGYVTNSDGGYVLSRNPDTVVAPDIGYFRADRCPDGLPDRGFLPHPPDFAVEVVSPSDEKGDVDRKIGLYRRAGVPLVWLVDPQQRTVTVYCAGQDPEVIGEAGTLDGGTVLPGFTLEVRAIFRDQ